MKKDTFFISFRESNGEIKAVKTTGYSDGDIGVHKNAKGDGWTATWIPLGLVICSDQKTAAKCLSAAQKILFDKGKSSLEEMFF
jgi:hypothetical protein